MKTKQKQKKANTLVFYDNFKMSDFAKVTKNNPASEKKHVRDAA